MAALEKAVAPYAGEKGNLRFPIERKIPYALLSRIVKFVPRRPKTNDSALASDPPARRIWLDITVRSHRRRERRYGTGRQSSSSLSLSSHRIGSHSSTLLPSGSRTQANLPFSADSGPFTGSIPIAFSCASMPSSESTR